MGVPLDHPNFYRIFAIVNHPFLGTPQVRKPAMDVAVLRSGSQASDSDSKSVSLSADCFTGR